MNTKRKKSFGEIVWDCGECGHKWNYTPEMRIVIIPGLGEIEEYVCPKCKKSDSIGNTLVVTYDKCSNTK